MKEFGDGFDGATFPTLVHIVAEIVIVSFHTLPVGFPGMFKNVRFYTILNFGLFWAPLFSRCFYPHNEFWPFLGLPPLLQDIRVLPHPIFSLIFGPTPLFELLEALFWPKRRPEILNFYPTRNFGHFWAALSKMSGFTPPEILAIFGPPPWSRDVFTKTRLRVFRVCRCFGVSGGSGGSGGSGVWGWFRWFRCLGVVQVVQVFGVVQVVQVVRVFKWFGCSSVWGVQVFGVFKCLGCSSVWVFKCLGFRLFSGLGV